MSSSISGIATHSGNAAARLTWSETARPGLVGLLNDIQRNGTGAALEPAFWRHQQMREQKIGRTSEFKNGDRRIVFLGETEVGVFKDNDEFFAYSNTCVHQGGPACEGLIIAKVEETIMPDKTSRGLYFSDTELHFVCPWHGYEYDLKTGECVGDRKLKLRRYEVVRKGDDLYVRG